MRGIVPLIVSAPGVDSVTMQPARQVPFGCVWLHSPPHSLALPWAKHFALPLTRSINHDVGHAISGIWRAALDSLDKNARYRIWIIVFDSSHQQKILK